MPTARGTTAPRGTIEPFDPARHDRAAFSCGVEQVDNFFKKTANKLVKADNLRVYVMMGAEGQLVGFYAINAHKVDYTELPAKYARDRPGHGSVVMLDVLDDGNAELVDKRKRLYAGYGFAPLPTNDMRLFLPLATVKQLIAESE